MIHTLSRPQRMSRFSATKAELLLEFHLMDRNRDGRVDYSEFTEMMKGLDAQLSDEEMRIGFYEVDTDRDGLISKEEFIDWWLAD